MNNVILKITRLSKRTTGSYVMDIFKQLGVCEVSRIVMSRYYVDNKQYKRAIIHVAKINDIEFFTKLANFGHAKIFHSDPHYWNIYLKSANKIKE